MIKLKSIDDQARALHKVLTEMGYESDPDLVSKRVSDLHNGLVHEDEFLYILSWLEKPIVAHKLEQFLVSSESKTHIKIPDLLLVIQGDEQEHRYLVEIKTTMDDRLKWSEKYYNGLREYGELMGIPVLVAWKWKSSDIWTLVKLEDFKQAEPGMNFKLTLQAAHRQNLMSQLLGDFAIWVPENFSFVIKQKKIKKLYNGEKFGWETIVEDVYFIGRGNKSAPLNDGALKVLHSLNADEVMEEDDEYLYYEIKPWPNQGLFAQSIPVRLMERDAEQQIHWQELIENRRFPITYSHLFSDLSFGIESGAIDQIAFLKPNYI